MTRIARCAKCGEEFDSLWRVDRMTKQFILALVASIWDWWPEMPGAPKAAPGAVSVATGASKEKSGHGPQPGQGRRMPVTEPPVPDTGDMPWLWPPMSMTVVSDRGGNHVAVGIPDLGELAVGSDNVGAHPRSAEPATQTAVVTWVHPGLDGNLRADGGVYSRWDPYYIASNDYRLGTVLVVSGVFTGVVVDRGLMGPNHLDLSEAGFQRLASLERGVVEVTVRAQTP